MQRGSRADTPAWAQVTARIGFWSVNQTSVAMRPCRELRASVEIVGVQGASLFAGIDHGDLDSDLNGYCRSAVDAPLAMKDVSAIRSAIQVGMVASSWGSRRCS